MYPLKLNTLAPLPEELPAEDKIILGTIGGLGGLGFVALAYPIYRGVACYMGQAEHLRSSFDPISISRKQLRTGGAVHSSFQILGAGGGFKALYYGLTPLLMCAPISIIGYSCAVAATTSLKTSEEPISVWKGLGIYLPIVACAEVACAPLRNLHLAMATYPSHEPYPRPTMRQLLKKHPHMWRAGLFPFITSAVLAAACHFPPALSDIVEDPTPLVSEGDEETAPLSLGDLSLMGVTMIAAHFAYLVGIRSIVDFTRHETIAVPKYTSWTQPWKFQFKSGWRTFAFGISASVGLQFAGQLSTIIPQLAEIARQEFVILSEEAENTPQDMPNNDSNQDDEA